jgi:hypothetical protein
VPDQSGLSVQVSLGLTSAQVQQLSKKNGGTGMSTKQATAVSQGSIFLDIKTGHGEKLSSAQAKTDADNSYDFGLQIGSDMPLELRYVHQNLYLRAQLSTLLSDVGSSTKASSIQSSLQQADQFVPGLNALGQGNWVEVSHASLQSLSGLLKQYSSSLGASGAAVNPSQYEAVYGKLAQDVSAALKANSTVQNEGTSNGRTKYEATLKVQPFLTQVGPALQTDLGSLPGVGSEFSGALNKAKTQIPADQTAVADLFVQNSKLQEIDVDVNQFTSASDKAPFPVPVKAVFGSPPSISVPSGATQLDLSKLPTLLSGLMGSLGGSNAGGSSSSSS